MPIIISPRQLTQRSQFYQQLGQLLSAGVTILKALDMLARKPPSRSYRQPIEEMMQQISQGGTVTDALTHLGKWTPAFDLAMVQAGEQSGRLDVIFRMLANHYADRASMLRQMLADLAYPAFLFHFAVLIFGFISWVNSTSATILLLQTVGLLGAVYIVTYLMIFASQSRRGEAWRSFLERFLRPIPILGTARQSMALARLAAALEALINAGVNIIEAWELAANASGSPALQRAVSAWKPELLAGRTPSEVVNDSREFPEVFANLYHSGEVSGQLDESLKRLHAYYQEDGSRKLHMVSQWVPRMIYLVIMLAIAYKIIGFYTGYFDQIRKAGGF